MRTKIFVLMGVVCGLILSPELSGAKDKKVTETKLCWMNYDGGQVQLFRSSKGNLRMAESASGKDIFTKKIIGGNDTIVVIDTCLGHLEITSGGGRCTAKYLTNFETAEVIKRGREKFNRAQIHYLETADKISGETNALCRGLKGKNAFFSIVKNAKDPNLYTLIEGRNPYTNSTILVNYDFKPGEAFSVCEPPMRVRYLPVTGGGGCGIELEGASLQNAIRDDGNKKPQ